MDWSSLPPELIHRIAGGLLDTADPTNTMDRRFRPHNWVMLDYPSHGEDSRVLVNTETGRFHVRDIPMLRRYFVVSVTTDGLLVLAEKVTTSLSPSPTHTGWRHSQLEGRTEGATVHHHAVTGGQVHWPEKYFIIQQKYFKQDAINLVVDQLCNPHTP